MPKHTPAVLLVALALGACGEDDRLTKQQLSSETTAQVERVTTAFGQVFQAIGNAKEASPVPGPALDRARAAAQTERAAAAALAGLRPPEAAEPVLNRFVAAAREQAERLEQTASGSPSVGELADVVEDREVREALGELAERGFAQVPRPEGS